MSGDGTTDEGTRMGANDQFETDSLEQRISALEEENKELKATLEQQQGRGLSDVTRRQTLGLLGGGALLGAAGPASATPPSGSDGPPFAAEDHDHSGDYLGQGMPVDRIDSGTVTARNELNNVEIVRPGDDIQAAIDTVYEAGDIPPTPSHPRRAQNEGNYSGMVRFLPNHPTNRLIYEFPEPPYVVRPGITLDMRGIVAELTTDAKALFDLRFGAEVIGHGAYINAERQNSFTGACWYVNGDTKDRPGVRNSAKVHGFPTLDVQGAPDGGARPILLEQRQGGSTDSRTGAIGGCRFEVNCSNTEGVVRINSAGTYGYINNNTIIARGAVASGNCVVYESSDGSIFNNHCFVGQLQVKGSVDRILYCRKSGAAGGITENRTITRSADYFNMNVAAAEWTNGVGPANPLLTSFRRRRYTEAADYELSAIDNSGTYGNIVAHLYREGRRPYDLSNRVGFFDGEIAPDDGTNTVSRGVLCTWDETRDGWIRPDGTMFEGDEQT